MSGSDGDIVFEDHGLPLLVDAQALPYVDGSRIDYVESLQGAGFQVNNPNVEAACGCGSSFRVEDEEQVSAVWRAALRPAAVCAALLLAGCGEGSDRPPRRRRPRRGRSRSGAPAAKPTVLATGLTESNLQRLWPAPTMRWRPASTSGATASWR